MNNHSNNSSSTVDSVVVFAATRRDLTLAFAVPVMVAASALLHATVGFGFGWPAALVGLLAGRALGDGVRAQAHSAGAVGFAFAAAATSALAGSSLPWLSVSVVLALWGLARR